MHKTLSLLGLARRAGKLSWSAESNMAAIRQGRACLLVLARDAGRATAKKYEDKCRTFGVPLLRYATAMELGRAVGLSPRPALAVLDEGFARLVLGSVREEKTF